MERDLNSRVEPAASFPASSPRIAYLLSQYPARSHTFFLNEIAGLREHGIDLEVASINAPDRPLHELPPREAAEADRTFYIKRTGRLKALLAIGSTLLRQPSVIVRGVRAILRLPTLSSQHRLFWLLYLAEAILLGRWMRARALPHLHVHFGGAVASVGMLASIAWRIPYSLTIHGPEELLDPPGYQLAAKIAQASFVVCISQFCRDQLRALTSPAEWSRLAVIPLGVDPSLLTPASPSSQGSARLRIVCVGRLVEAKGHRVLLEALHLLATHNVGFEAVLIGTGPLEAELRRVVEQHQLTDFVTFTSGLSHAETLAHVRSADIFALASFAEGVPVALMEAMSLAVPCVSTTIAGIPELIESGESGLLVPPGEPAAFADALESLAHDGRLRRRLGSAGRQRVIAHYNLPHNLLKLAEHFRERLLPPTVQSITQQRQISMRQA